MEQNNLEQVTFSLKEWLQLTQDSLQVIHKLIKPTSPKAIRVRNVYLTNADTVTTEFTPYSSNSIDIKVEIARVMAFFPEFLELLDCADEINSIAVRAFSTDDEEMMYALASVETARLAGKGVSIEWLQKTIFQDTSADFRLQVAKRKINQLEGSLRTLIVTVLKSAKGDDWWTKGVDKAIRDKALKNWKNQSGNTVPKSDELIKYTYLLDLKDTVKQHWGLFKGYFSDPISFQNDMTAFNKIRRDEAHNRPPSQAVLNELEAICNRLLSGMASSHPDVVASFLLDNWHLKLATIIKELAQAIPNLESSDRYNLSKTRAAFNELRRSWDEGFERASTIIVPPGKEPLHNHFLSAMEAGLLGLNQVWDSLEQGNPSSVKDGFNLYQNALSDLKEFQRQYLMSEKGQ